MNAKNLFGAYTGVETVEQAVAFFGVAPSVFDTCTKAVWRPFREMNGNG